MKLTTKHFVYMAMIVIGNFGKCYGGERSVYQPGSYPSEIQQWPSHIESPVMTGAHVPPGTPATASMKNPYEWGQGGIETFDSNVLQSSSPYLTITREKSPVAMNLYDNLREEVEKLKKEHNCLKQELTAVLLQMNKADDHLDLARQGSAPTVIINNDATTNPQVTTMTATTLAQGHNDRRRNFSGLKSLVCTMVVLTALAQKGPQCALLVSALLGSGLFGIHIFYNKIMEN